MARLGRTYDRILEVVASELRASVHADRALDALRAR